MAKTNNLANWSHCLMLIAKNDKKLSYNCVCCKPRYWVYADWYLASKNRLTHFYGGKDFSMTFI